MSCYNVPVIPLNLRKEETIIQIAESLNYLTEVSNDIFKKITKRIEKGTDHLDELNGRIEKVNRKIAKVSGAKKAIQVFSSSKYPAGELNKPYKTLFVEENVPRKQKFYVKYKDIPLKDEPLETLQFYHLNFIDNQKPNYEGLGEIPRNNIDNVNDLLLYNSGTNLYSKYIIADALKVLQKTKKEIVNEGPEIGAAPLSISEPSVVPKHSGENYFYSPHLGDVPTIDVPIDLPDLPGIADDLRYTDSSDRTIAPSVITSPNIPELPEIITTPNQSKSDVLKGEVKSENIKEEIKIASNKSEEIQKSPKEIKLGTNEISVLSEAPKKIKPQGLNDSQSLNKSEALMKSESLNKSEPLIKSESLIKSEPLIKSESLIKPEPLIESNSVDGNLTQIPSKPIIPDMHASLMDAIRKAGGMKKLKATEPKKEVEVKKPTGGDLMADLHSKLLMRRKGISGAEKANGIEPGSAMDRISAMLPPPPSKTEQSESGTTDDDWED